MRLKDKVCMITGSGKGIGRETAKLFHRQGARLAVMSRCGDDLASLKRELRCPGKKVLAFAGDASAERDAAYFVREAIAKFGRIDILINNAGMRFRKGFLETTPDEWDKVLGNNLKSAYLFCREAGRHMVARRSGRIINISSIIGGLGLPELSAYAASKGGLEALTKCLALEWAKYNINVNAVAPGFCETSYAEDFKKNKRKLYRFTIERTPQGKWGAALDVANACLFLAAGESRYITGEVLRVDGGWGAW